MAMRKTKPTSPGRRFATFQLREEVTTDRPHKPLASGKPSSGGRNARGRVTSRHRGGGAKSVLEERGELVIAHLARGHCELAMATLGIGVAVDFDVVRRIHERCIDCAA